MSAPSRGLSLRRFHLPTVRATHLPPLAFRESIRVARPLRANDTKTHRGTPVPTKVAVTDTPLTEP